MHHEHSVQYKGLSDERGINDLALDYCLERFVKGNQIRGRDLCFQPGPRDHGSNSGARLLRF